MKLIRKCAGFYETEDGAFSATRDTQKGYYIVVDRRRKDDYNPEIPYIVGYPYKLASVRRAIDRYKRERAAVAPAAVAQEG